MSSEDWESYGDGGAGAAAGVGSCLRRSGAAPGDWGAGGFADPSAEVTRPY